MPELMMNTDTLMDRIQTRQQAIVDNLRATVTLAWEQGSDLHMLKEQLPHGDFGQALERLSITRMTASRWMRLATHYAHADELPAGSTLTGLLAPPPPPTVETPAPRPSNRSLLTETQIMLSDTQDAHHAAQQRIRALEQQVEFFERQDDSNGAEHLVVAGLQEQVQQVEQHQHRTKAKLDDAVQDNHGLKRAYRKARQDIENMAVQLDTLRHTLTERDHELDRLRRMLDGNEQAQQIARLNNENQYLRMQIDRLRQNL